MKRRKALLLCVASGLILVVYLGFYLWKTHYEGRLPVQSTAEIMGIPVVDNLDFLEGKEKLAAETNPGVYFEKTLLPYSALENTLYLSQNLTVQDWEGDFSAGEGAFLCMLPDSHWDNKAETIREGYAFTLWMVEEDAYYEMSLVVSGMPVITVDTERMEEQEKVPYEVDPDKLYYDSEDLYYGSIRVFDCGSSDRAYEIVESNVRYHYKGATTAAFDKKGYSLSLQDVYGDKLDVSLLGMREDSSWKLNALVTDSNRIREITASQLWEELVRANTNQNAPGPRMEYAELVVDNDYKGLYCLVEPVDEEKLELDNNDVLYKCIDWNPPADEEIQQAIDMKWRIMYPIRIRYPEVISHYEKTWYPMRDYINKVYYSYDGFQNIAEMVYPENTYDMLMFLMVTNGTDNYFKNMYFAADVSTDGSYVMRMIPWDLDYTFGNVYDYESENASRFDEDVTKEYPLPATTLLIQYSPESKEDILAANWEAYRADFLSTGAIQELMVENRDYLVNTGVVARENERWPQYPMDTDIQYLLDFQEDRMNWLDGYFGGLAN